MKVVLVLYALSLTGCAALWAGAGPAAASLVAAGAGAAANEVVQYVRGETGVDIDAEGIPTRCEWEVTAPPRRVLWMCEVCLEKGGCDE